jgi:hypothetical protein
MAIHDVVTAREARVVAGELKRLANNLRLYLVLEGLAGKDVSTGKNVLDGLDRFGDLLLNQASGKKETDEIFLPEGHLEAAEKDISDMFGGFGK